MYNDGFFRLFEISININILECKLSFKQGRKSTLHSININILECKYCYRNSH